MVAADAPAAWHDRFVDRRMVDPEQLMAHPDNWRIHPLHQQNVVEESLDQLGWIDEVKCQEGTDLVFDGHLRVTLALRNGEAEIPVAYYNLTDDEVALALTVKDTSAALAEVDKEKLGVLLDRVRTDSAPQMQRMMDDLRRKHLPAMHQVPYDEHDTPAGLTAGSGSRVGAASEATFDDDPELIECPHCGHSFLP